MTPVQWGKFLSSIWENLVILCRLVRSVLHLPRLKELYLPRLGDVGSSSELMSLSEHPELQIIDIGACIAPWESFVLASKAPQMRSLCVMHVEDREQVQVPPYCTTRVDL